MNQNIQSIFSILIICILVYLIIRLNKKEQFAISDIDINSIYKIDIAAMRNLAGISSMIYDVDKKIATIPASKVIQTNLQQPTIYPNLFTQYMIIPWAGHIDNIPRGWVICNGLVYSKAMINEYFEGTSALIGFDKSIVNIGNQSGFIYTPDLRGKFILNTNSTYPLNSYGGESYNIIQKTHIPKHQHKLFLNINGNKCMPFGSSNTILKYKYTPPSPIPINATYPDGSLSGNAYTIGMANNDTKDVISNPDNNHYKEYQTNGGNYNRVNISPKNNMPPYYALIYIMKV